MSKRKAADNELRYGLDIHSGELRYVKDVPNGKDCDCICPGCKRPLEACHPKDEFDIRPYFRHRKVEGNENAECANPQGARETIVHFLTKAVLLKLTSFYLPPKYVGENEYKGHLMKGYEVLPSVEWFVTNGRDEDHSIHKGFVPDVIFDTPKGSLIVEVLYSHKVHDEKRSLLSDLGFYAVELNVKDMQPDEIGITPILRKIDSTRFCKWISYPLSTQDEVHLEAWKANEAKRIDELVAEEKKEKERLERQRLAEEQHKLELIERAKLIEERNRQQELLKRKQEEAAEKERWKIEYEVTIKEYFKKAGDYYDIPTIPPAEQEKIKNALKVLRSQLDSAYPSGSTRKFGQRLIDEVKSQVEDRKNYVKKKRLESIASMYIFHNIDEEFEELVARGWEGENVVYIGRTERWVPYLKHEIPKKVVAFLNEQAKSVGLVKAVTKQWPNHKIDNIPF